MKKNDLFVMAAYAVVLASLIALVGTVSDFFAEAVFLGEKRDSFINSFIRMLIAQAVYISFAWLVVRALNRRLSWVRHTLLRISAEVGAVLGLSALLVLFAGIMGSLTRPDVTPEDFGRFLMVVSMTSFLMGLIAFGFTEVWFRIVEIQQLEKNIVQLEHKITLSQFEALRQQLNPHFLFNSLNTLASLIYVDVAKADAFIQEFAEVYRYVLRLTNTPTVTVREELDFLHSYLFLLRIRFNDNLQFTEAVDPGLYQGNIPPLTLQLLIENAIKHNEVSDQRPLHIQLESEGDQLVVRNNVQLRQDVRASNGLGWKNLRERYALMGAPIPSYTHQADAFTARVPVILDRHDLQRADRRG